MGRLSYRLGLRMLTAARSWEKIRKALNEGEKVNLVSFLTVFTSLTTIRLRRFSIVLPKTELFINLKKSFSKSLEDCFLSVLNPMYVFNHLL